MHAAEPLSSTWRQGTLASSPPLHRPLHSSTPRYIIKTGHVLAKTSGGGEASRPPPSSDGKLEHGRERSRSLREGGKGRAAVVAASTRQQQGRPRQRRQRPAAPVPDGGGLESGSWAQSCRRPTAAAAASTVAQRQRHRPRCGQRRLTAGGGNASPAPALDAACRPPHHGR